MLTLLLLACTGDTTTSDSAVVDTGPEPALEYRFSFALIADPHIVSSVEHEERLIQVRDWIDAEAEARGIALVLVLGDIGWGAGLERSYELLDGFQTPWMPIAGDNMIVAGDEEAWQAVFQPQIAELGELFGGVDQALQPVWNPLYEQESWHANYTLRHQGVTFMALDWVSRSDHVLYSETAELQDHDGGTWQWFEEQILTLGDVADESVIMASHNAMHFGPGSFDLATSEELMARTAPYADQLAASYGGHLHLDLDDTSWTGGWDVQVIDATWDDSLSLAIVDVWGNDRRFAYELERLKLER